jgi:ribosomal protein S27AE
MSPVHHAWEAPPVTPEQRVEIHAHQKQWVPQSLLMEDARETHRAIYAIRRPAGDVLPPECPRCGGSGEVVENRSWRRDPQQEESGRCPRCHGTGVA